MEIGTRYPPRRPTATGCTAGLAWYEAQHARLLPVALMKRGHSPTSAQVGTTYSHLHRSGRLLLQTKLLASLAHRPAWPGNGRFACTQACQTQHANSQLGKGFSGSWRRIVNPGWSYSLLRLDLHRQARPGQSFPRSVAALSPLGLGADGVFLQLQAHERPAFPAVEARRVIIVDV